MAVNKKKIAMFECPPQALMHSNVAETKQFKRIRLEWAKEKSHQELPFNAEKIKKYMLNEQQAQRRPVYK